MQPVEELKYVRQVIDGIDIRRRALVIRYGSEEKYVIQQFGVLSNMNLLTDEIIFSLKAGKTEFSTKEEMLKIFDQYCKDGKLDECESTDEGCGYPIPATEFQKAHEIYMDRILQRFWKWMQ